MWKVLLPVETLKDFMKRDSAVLAYCVVGADAAYPACLGKPCQRTPGPAGPRFRSQGRDTSRPPSGKGFGPKTWCHHDRSAYSRKDAPPCVASSPASVIDVAREANEHAFRSKGEGLGCFLCPRRVNHAKDGLVPKGEPGLGARHHRVRGLNGRNCSHF